MDPPPRYTMHVINTDVTEEGVVITSVYLVFSVSSQRFVDVFQLLAKTLLRRNKCIARGHTAVYKRCHDTRTPQRYLHFLVTAEQLV